MINNRLFKKINSIFWGILTWLPVVLLILSSIIFNFEPQINEEGNLGVYIEQFFLSASQFMSNDNDFWYNPITSVLYEINPILDTVASGPFHLVLIDIAGWMCWVQVIRLLVYVFYWFIDLISGLFDLMTFNRKGDN